MATKSFLSYLNLLFVFSFAFFVVCCQAPDNIATHIASGLTAGLAATLLGSPVDVVKSNVMAASKSSSVVSGATTSTAAPFNGSLSCAAYLWKKGGVAAFYKGFIPNFARIGSWNIITWVTLEQLKKMYLQQQGLI